MVTFLVLALTGFTFLSLFGLRECLVLWVISMLSVSYISKDFVQIYRRHYELVSKFNVGLKTFLHQGLSEPEFYGDLVYKHTQKCR